MKSFTFLSIICCALIIIGCGDDPVVGCMDPAAQNFDPLAEEDSGNCTYKRGCTDENAANYDPEAVEDSGDCQYPGCTDVDGDTYDAMFNQDDGSCTYFNRFLGSYQGTFVCQGIFGDLLDEASSIISKRPGGANQDSIIVTVSNPATDITLILDGTITKDDVTLDTYIENFEYTLDLGELVIEGPFEVFVTGVLDRMEDESLVGDININIVKPGTGLGASDICNYVATKE